MARAPRLLHDSHVIVKLDSNDSVSSELLDGSPQVFNVGDRLVHGEGMSAAARLVGVERIEPLARVSLNGQVRIEGVCTIRQPKEVSVDGRRPTTRAVGRARWPVPRGLLTCHFRFPSLDHLRSVSQSRGLRALTPSPITFPRSPHGRLSTWRSGLASSSRFLHRRRPDSKLLGLGEIDLVVLPSPVVLSTEQSATRSSEAPTRPCLSRSVRRATTTRQRDRGCRRRVGGPIERTNAGLLAGDHATWVSSPPASPPCHPATPQSHRADHRGDRRWRCASGREGPQAGL